MECQIEKTTTDRWIMHLHEFLTDEILNHSKRLIARQQRTLGGFLSRRRCPWNLLLLRVRDPGGAECLQPPNYHLNESLNSSSYCLGSSFSSGC
jgi:hypothetical protein